jgi:cobalt-zinc-cadmium resistance protein CzcA
MKNSKYGFIGLQSPIITNFVQEISKIFLYTALLFVFIANIAFGQSNSQTFPNEVKLPELLSFALKNNGNIKIANSQIELQQNFRKTATDIGKTNISLQYGQYNSFVNDNNLTISQSFPFPTVLMRQANLAKAQLKNAELQLLVSKNELLRNVKSAYTQWLFTEAKHNLLLYQDSIFTEFLRAAELRFKTGETNQLEQSVAQLQLLEVRNQKAQNQADTRIAETQLQTFLHTKAPLNLAKNVPFTKLTLLQNIENNAKIDSNMLAKNPFLALLQQQIVVNEKAKLVEKAKLLPDINLGFSTQTLVGYQTQFNKQETYYDNSSRFNYLLIGVSIPLWAKPQIARAKVAEIQQQIAQNTYNYTSRNLEGQYLQLIQEYLKLKTTLEYYENSALPTANLILLHGQKGFKNGEIGYVEYFQALKSGVTVKNMYLDMLNQYNQTVIMMEFLLGNE